MDQHGWLFEVCRKCSVTYGNMPMHEAKLALDAVAGRGVAAVELETSPNRAMDEADARGLSWDDQLRINPVYGAALGFSAV